MAERWFVSKDGPVGGKRLVCAEPRFANRVVVVCATEADAERVVRMHNLSIEQNGPAETAISPSHGPTTPTEGTAMDVRSDNTPAAPAAIPFNYEAAFESFEAPVNVALSRARVVEHLIAKIERHSSDNGVRRIHEGEYEALVFMIGELSTVVREIDDLWLKHNNDSVHLEREIDLARRAS